jgi:hypothetical protein
MYVRVMMKLEIRGIELVARMVDQNDVGDESYQSSMLPEAVDEQGIKCGIVLTQPTQESQCDADADEPPFIGSNKTMLNVEPFLGSVYVGDVVANVGMISGVDPQLITVVASIGYAPSIFLEFMAEYDATFGDERAEDSADDHPVLELSNREMVLLPRALVEHAANMPNCQDLS